MSTVEVASPRPERATGGLVPAPPIPARSRLRGAPSSGNIKRDAASSNTTPTPRTPTAHLPSSPSDSSIGSTSSSSGKDVYSPGVPLTPSTPAINGTQYPSLSRAAGNAKAEYGFGDYLAHGAAAGPSVWPGKLEHSPTSPMAPPAAGQPKRSRFSRGSRHSSSGSVSLSASSDPLRVKDGVAPRGSASGIYTRTSIYTPHFGSEVASQFRLAWQRAHETDVTSTHLSRSFPPSFHARFHFIHLHPHESRDPVR